MIRKTLNTTKLATYSVELPNLSTNLPPGMPLPTGTGFFFLMMVGLSQQHM
jgi:hypothetical protein